MTPYLITAGAVTGLAWCYHGFTEHHWHLRFWRHAQPDTVIPAHDPGARWHGMAHGRRGGITVILTAAAMAAGFAWQIEHAAAIVTAAVLAVAVIAVCAARLLARPLGTRHYHHRREN